MAQATRTMTMSERIHWNDFIRPWLVRLIFAGLGLLVGLYILGPQRTRTSESYVPASYSAIPFGVAQFTGSDGVNILLPVRLADSSTTRSSGFNDVGPAAVGNAFVLYAQSRETTRTTTYDMTDIRAPLEIAVIDASGLVVALQRVLPGNESTRVEENHRWLLASRQGALEAKGIGEGSQLDPESIVKLNF